MAEANHTKYLRIALLLVGQIFIVGIITPTSTLSAQQAVKHLNPVIEKLAAGKPFIGFQTGDLSLENARTLARADIDYVYLEMEHGPMDFEGMHRFTVGMIDKTAILKKGQRPAKRGDIRALCSLRPRTGTVVREAGARHRLDGRDLQWNRQPGAGATGRTEHALSTEEDFEVPRAARIARLRARNRCLVVGRF